MGTIEGHHPTYEEDSSRNGSTSPTRMFRVLIHVISYLRASAGHRSEIRCASMSSDIWSRECAGGIRLGIWPFPGPVCEQGAGGIRLGIWPFPGFSCVRVRVLGVWPYGLSSPSVSGRMASGLSPHGAASFYTLGWGSGLSRVEWSAIYPVPAPHLFPTPTGAPCALTPQG